MSEAHSTVADLTTPAQIADLLRHCGSSIDGCRECPNADAPDEECLGMYIRAADLIETQVRYEERLQALFDACIDGREEMRKATKAQTLVILARYSAATIAEINRRCMTAGIDACKTCPLSVDEDMPVDYTCTDALGAAASDTIDHLLERLGEARRAEG